MNANGDNSQNKSKLKVIDLKKIARNSRQKFEPGNLFARFLFSKAIGV